MPIINCRLQIRTDCRERKGTEEKEKKFGSDPNTQAFPKSFTRDSICDSDEVTNSRYRGGSADPKVNAESNNGTHDWIDNDGPDTL